MEKADRQFENMRIVARERLLRRMVREAKKTPAPEGEHWLEQ